jgi:hypothetical protein
MLLLCLRRSLVVGNAMGPSPLLLLLLVVRSGEWLLDAGAAAHAHDDDAHSLLAAAPRSAQGLPLLLPLLLLPTCVPCCSKVPAAAGPPAPPNHQDQKPQSCQSCQ